MTTLTPLNRDGMSDWQLIDVAPEMRAILLFHEYYSHGRVRHGYLNLQGEWIGVNATGTEAPLNFRPTHWMPLPETRDVQP
jgi:hypothetical protein